MMSAIPKRKFTIEEYIEFDKSSEGKWEYEVLSASTKAYDFDLKFTAYQSIESFQEYLLIAQDRPHVTQYVRQSDGQWLRRDIAGMDATIKLATVECELTFTEIYRLVKFSPAESGIRLV
jgi:Uma2 family endonuclease